MTSTNLLYIYVIIINVVTFFIYGLDKSKAKAGQWRIPEAQLIFLAVIGGSVGALAGMKVFHHKTRKPKFKTGVPAILIIQLIIYFLFSGNEGDYSALIAILINNAYCYSSSERESCVSKADIWSAFFFARIMLLL